MNFTALEKAVLHKAYGFVSPYPMNLWIKWLKRLLYELASWVRETQDPFCRDIVLLDTVEDIAVKIAKVSKTQAIVTLISVSTVDVVDVIEASSNDIPSNDVWREMLFRWASPCTCGAAIALTDLPCSCTHGILSVLRFHGEVTGRCPMTGEHLGCVCGFHPSMFELVYRSYTRNFVALLGSVPEPVFAEDYPSDRKLKTDAPKHQFTIQFTKGPAYILRLLESRSSANDKTEYVTQLTTSELSAMMKHGYL